MATLKSVIEYVDSVKPNAFTNEVKTQWVNEAEGLVQTEVLLLAIEEVQTYTWEDDQDTVLLACPPHDKLYRAYLTAMVDFANGEYNRYANTLQMFNAHLGEYQRWFAHIYRPADTHLEVYADAGTLIDTEWRGYYITAYGIAVKHGYTGTEAEWLESLKGPSLEFASPEQFGALGDGVHDDTEAWQQAVDTGKPVMAAGGTYKITGTIYVTKDIEIDCGDAEFLCVGTAARKLFWISKYIPDDIDSPTAYTHAETGEPAETVTHQEPYTAFDSYYGITGGSLAGYDDLETGGIDEYGEETENASARRTGYIPVTAGADYWLRGLTAYPYIYYYDAERQPIMSSGRAVRKAARYDEAVVPIDGCAYIRMSGSAAAFSEDLRVLPVTDWSGFALLRGRNWIQPTKTDYKGGFMCEFRRGRLTGAYPVDVTANTEDPEDPEYSADGVCIDKLDPISVRLSRVGDIRHEDESGDPIVNIGVRDIQVFRGFGCTVSDCSIDSSGAYMVIQYIESLQCTVERCRITQHAILGDALQNAYLICGSSTSCLTVRDCYLYNATWHCVTNGGANPSYLCYRTVVDNCKLEAHGQYAYLDHGNARGSEVRHSAVSGIYLMGMGTVEDVDVTSMHDEGGSRTRLRTCMVTLRAVPQEKAATYILRDVRLRPDRNAAAAYVGVQLGAGDSSHADVSYYFRDVVLDNVRVFDGGTAREKLTFRIDDSNTAQIVAGHVSVRGSDLSVELLDGYGTRQQINTDGLRVTIADTVQRGAGLWPAISGEYKDLTLQNVHFDSADGVSVSGALTGSGVYAPLTGEQLLEPETVRINDLQTDAGARFDIWKNAAGRVCWQEYDAATGALGGHGIYAGTATGTVVTITDAADGQRLLSAAAAIEPVQAEGTPAPAAPLPITGRTGVTVTLNGETAAAVTFPETPGTVYKGTLDLKTGLLTVTHALADFSANASAFAPQSSYSQQLEGVTVFYTSMANRNAIMPGLRTSNTDPNNYYLDNGLMGCSHFPLLPVSLDAWQGVVGFAVNSRESDSGGNIWLIVPESIAEDKTQLVAWLQAESTAGRPVQAWYPLAEPVIYQLAGVTMPELAEGTNVMSADSGDLTVRYIKEF